MSLNNNTQLFLRTATECTHKEEEERCCSKCGVSDGDVCNDTHECEECSKIFCVNCMSYELWGVTLCTDCGEKREKEEEDEDEIKCSKCGECNDDIHECWECNVKLCVDCDENEMATYGEEGHTYCADCGERREEEGESDWDPYEIFEAQLIARGVTDEVLQKEEEKKSAFEVAINSGVLMTPEMFDENYWEGRGGGICMRKVVCVDC
jgi:hypothetical protein